ncbi:MAG: CHC2 zinc finger domain-containing protein [Clostridium sp.]|nr:CHC2 zinc finger domain-containing protein [Clostridium sp.]
MILPLLVTRAIHSKKEKISLLLKYRKYIIAKAFSKRKKEIAVLSIFSEVKERITAIAVAEFYGLKVTKKGMACCPFHNDRHPSMKIDRFYYCFACGAKGDAINYVADTYGLSQYDAARKIADDFHIHLESGTEKNDKARARALEKVKAAEQEQKRILYIQRQFNEWCNRIIWRLKECEQIIESAKKF